MLAFTDRSLFLRPDFKIHEPTMEKAILAFIQFALEFSAY